MGVEAAQASWLGIVASSAVVSALVNLGSNWWMKQGDRQREDLKERQRMGHVYLEIMLQLETFANRCDAYLNDIYDALGKHYEHDPKAFDKINESAFLLKFDPEPEWKELPVPFVSSIKAILGDFSTAGDWINREWAGWIALDDAYQLEEERIAFYGLRAAEIAAQIRKDINAGQESHIQLNAGRAHFLNLINSRREAFRQRPDGMNLIPELKALFESELITQK